MKTFILPTIRFHFDRFFLCPYYTFQSSFKSIGLVIFFCNPTDKQINKPTYTQTKKQTQNLSYNSKEITSSRSWEAVAQWVSAVIFESEDSKFKPHCSQHVDVSLRHFTPNCSCGDCPQYWVCKSLWIKASNKWHLIKLHLYTTVVVTSTSIRVGEYGRTGSKGRNLS